MLTSLLTTLVNQPRKCLIPWKPAWKPRLGNIRKSAVSLLQRLLQRLGKCGISCLPRCLPGCLPWAKNARFHGYRLGYLAGYRPSKADSPALRVVQRSRPENCAFHGVQVGESPANALGRGAGGNQSSIAGLHHLAQPQHGVHVVVTRHGHRLRRCNRACSAGVVVVMLDALSVVPSACAFFAATAHQG